MTGQIRGYPGFGHLTSVFRAASQTVPKFEQYGGILKEQLQGLLVEVPDRGLAEVVWVLRIVERGAQLFLTCAQFNLDSNLTCKMKLAQLCVMETAPFCSAGRHNPLNQCGSHSISNMSV